MLSVTQLQLAPLPLDLTGEWIGFYPGHFDEVVSVVKRDGCWEATKITGDDYVPAGEISWRVQIDTLKGVGQIAGHGFRDPTWVSGHLTILDADHICFTWNHLGSVEFRRDS